MAEQWAGNLAQWVRTASTDLYRGIGEAEIGHKPTMAKQLKEMIVELEAMEKKLELKYQVPSRTGQGRKRKRKEKKS